MNPVKAGETLIKTIYLKQYFLTMFSYNSIYNNPKNNINNKHIYNI